MEIGKVNDNILDIDGQLSTLSDDGEATRREVQTVLAAQQGVSADGRAQTRCLSVRGWIVRCLLGT